jgi:hypothetical protein
MGKLLSVLLILFALPLHAEKPAQPTVRIFVGPRTGVDGFVDSTRMADTVTDIRNNLVKRPGVINVASEEQAEIFVEVVYSGMMPAGSQTTTNLNRGIFGGVVATTSTQQKLLPSVGVQLHVHGSAFTKDIVITAQMFWKDLAKAAANQSIMWINTNWAQLQKAKDK